MATPTNEKPFSAGLAKVLAEKWQVDVRLKAMNSDESSAISAHKLILASRSEVFKKMLELDEVKTSAKQVETITISDMKQEELEAFVEFIYSDGSMLSAKAKQHARSLYLAADKYEILHLRDLCRIELISSLSLSNYLDILELAQILFDKVLKDAAFSYIQKNMNTIASSNKFKLFIVSNPNLAVEIKLFIALKLLSSSITLSCPHCGYNLSKNETRIKCSSCGCNYSLDCGNYYCRH